MWNQLQSWPVLFEIDIVWFRMWVQYLIEQQWKLGLWNVVSMYVAFWDINCWNLISFFLKDKSVRLWVVDMNFTNKVIWKIHLGCESLFSVLLDQNHWWEWLNTHSESELLSSADQIRIVNGNGWTCVQDVSSPAFEHIRITYENGKTCIQLVGHSPVFEHIRTTDKNC